jgi:YggT family protein
MFLDIIVSAERLLINALVFIIFVQALASWMLPQFSGKQWSILLRELSDPILMPIRQVLPTFGSIDFSPLVAILLLEFVLGPLLINITLRLA